MTFLGGGEFMGGRFQRVAEFDMNDKIKLLLFWM